MGCQPHPETWSIFCIMLSYIKTNLGFGHKHGLTLTQTTTLSAFMQIRDLYDTKRMQYNLAEWYSYSEQRMVDLFPAIYQIPKRVYKNLQVIERLGFVRTMKIDGQKWISFTEKCNGWEG